MKTANYRAQSWGVCGFAVLCVTTPPSGLDAGRGAQMLTFLIRVNR